MPPRAAGRQAMRRARIKADGAGYYHCMSRIIERRWILGDAEKEKLLRSRAQGASAAYAGGGGNREDVVVPDAAEVP